MSKPSPSILGLFRGAGIISCVDVDVFRKTSLNGPHSTPMPTELLLLNWFPSAQNGEATYPFPFHRKMSEFERGHNTTPESAKVKQKNQRRNWSAVESSRRFASNCLSCFQRDWCFLKGQAEHISESMKRVLLIVSAVGYSGTCVFPSMLTDSCLLKFIPMRIW